MPFYVYKTDSGDLISKNLISYAGRLNRGQAEVKLTPESEYHTVWDDAAAATGRPVLLDNGGSVPPTREEVYADFKRRVALIVDESEDRDEILLRNESIGDLIR